MPLRVVPSYSRLPSKRCPSIGFLSRAEREIGKLVQDKEQRTAMREASFERAKKFPKMRFYNEFVEVFENEGIRKK